MKDTLVSMEVELSNKHSGVMNEFMKEQFKTIQSKNVRNQFVSDVFKLKTDVYCEVIAATSKKLKDVFMYKEDILAFYNGIKNSPKITDTTITIPMHSCPDDIPDIKSGVLKNYVNTVEVNIDNWINNQVNDKIVKTIDGREFDAMQAEMVAAVSDITLYNMKENIAKSSFKENKSIRELIKSPIPVVDVPVTTEYIDSTVIPFISKYESYKIGLCKKGTEIISDIKKETERMNVIRKILSKFTSQPDTSKKFKDKLEKYFFNAEKNFLELCAYTAFIYVRTASAYIFDCSNYTSFVNEFKNTYNQLSDVYQEIADTSFIFPLDGESVTRDFLSNGCNSLIGYVDNIMRYHTFLITGISRKTDTPYDDSEEKIYELLEDITYDKYPYDNMKQMYGEISQSLDIIAEKCDDYLQPFDNLLSEAGLIGPINQKYNKVMQSIENTDIYGTDISLLTLSDGGKEAAFRILKELNEFPDTIVEISSLATMVYNKINEIIGRMKTNINGEYKHGIIIEKTITFLNDFIDQYKEITKQFMRGLIKRLCTLNCLLEKYEVAQDNVYKESVDVKIKEPNFDQIYIEGSIACDELKEEMIFTNLLKNYHKERVLKESGIELVYEDGEEKKSISPSVTIKGEIDQNTATDKSNTSGNSTESKESAATSLKKSVIDILNGLIKKLTDSIKSESNKANKNSMINFIDDNKDMLVSRRYTNISITLPPYSNMPMKEVYSNVTTFKTNVLNLFNDTTSIKSLNDVRAKTLSFVEQNPFITINGGNNEQGNDDFKDGLRKYYCVKNAQYAEQTYNDSQCNEVINKCFEWLDGYYGNDFTNITNELQSISDQLAGEGIASKIKNSNDPDIQKKVQWISDTVTAFDYAVIRSSSEKTHKIVELFKKIISSTKPKNPKPENTEQTNEQVENNNDISENK